MLLSLQPFKQNDAIPIDTNSNKNVDGMVHVIDNAVIFGDNHPDDTSRKRPSNHIDDMMAEQKKTFDELLENNEMLERNGEVANLKEVEFAKDFKVIFISFHILKNLF